MSLILRQINEQKGRIDLRGITPQRLATLELPAIEQLRITADHQMVPLSSLFSVEGDPMDELIIIPGNNRVDYIGARMASGTITLSGDAGNHAGSGMLGGRLLVNGNGGDFTGSAMQGGEIIVQGNVGNATGAPSAGGLCGQNGGVIHVQGHAGDRAGECQRRGLLIIEGDAGDLAGYRMIAGTIYVGGRTGEHTGLGMRRGTILLNHRPDQLPVTLNHNGSLPLTMLTLVIRQLRHYLVGKTPEASFAHRVDRYVGDLACQGLGEIIVLT